MTDLILVQQLSITDLILVQQLSITDLILEETAAERPDAAEDEVELVDLLVCVGRCVLRGEHALEQEAEHLQVADVRDRRDLLEAHLNIIKRKNRLAISFLYELYISLQNCD